MTKMIKPGQLRMAVLLISSVLFVENVPVYANNFPVQEIICNQDQLSGLNKTNLLIASGQPAQLQHINESGSIVKTPDDYSVLPKLNKNFGTEYSAITKKILLAAIELERFSLNYRAECLRPSVIRQIRYVCFQEAGAAGALTFEIIATNQFNIGRNHPLKLSVPALKGAFTTSLVTSVIAGSGSCLELLNDCFDAIKHKHDGYDPGSAKQYVLKKLNQIDTLLAERENIVSAYKDQVGYRRALLEGQILNELRNAFVEEFNQFNVNVRSYAAFRDCFYLTNIATNVLAATAAGIGYRATTDAKLNGPTNILFIVTGAVALSSSLISNAASKYVSYHERHSFLDKVKNYKPFDSANLTAIEHSLQELSAESSGSLIPELPIKDRLTLYMHSGKLFRKQLAGETAMMSRLNQVALQSSFLGPAVGATFMTQGILGTIGYYKYTIRPRAQLNHYYSGAIVGLTGASAELIGTAAWLVASLTYEHKLAKEKRLPRQLIAERLNYLDNLQKTIISLP